jgi:hypothetical protein
MGVYEYGIFTEEGCIEASMWSLEEAEARAQTWRADAVSMDVDETYTAKQMCEEHRDAEQAKDSCEQCFAEEDQ